MEGDESKILKFVSFLSLSPTLIPLKEFAQMKITTSFFLIYLIKLPFSLGEK
jgi:hypothetical protein